MVETAFRLRSSASEAEIQRVDDLPELALDRFSLKAGLPVDEAPTLATRQRVPSGSWQNEPDEPTYFASSIALVWARSADVALARLTTETSATAG